METAGLNGSERICRDCGAPLGPGREDRLYCDQNCKTNFNNKKRREQQPKELSGQDYITRIQEVLLKNRSILESLCTEEEPGRLKMRDLLGKSFNPKFFTSEEATKKGDLYRFCFEYGYHLNVEDYAIIVCRKREVL